MDNWLEGKPRQKGRNHHGSPRGTRARLVQLIFTRWWNLRGLNKRGWVGDAAEKPAFKQETAQSWASGMVAPRGKDSSIRHVRAELTASILILVVSNLVLQPNTTTGKEDSSHHRMESEATNG